MIHRASASHERYVRGVHSTQLLSKDQKTAGTPHADAVRTGWRVAAARTHGLASWGDVCSCCLSCHVWPRACGRTCSARPRPTYARDFRCTRRLPYRPIFPGSAVGNMPFCLCGRPRAPSHVFAACCIVLAQARCPWAQRWGVRLPAHPLSNMHAPPSHAHAAARAIRLPAERRPIGRPLAKRLRAYYRPPATCTLDAHRGGDGRLQRSLRVPTASRPLHGPVPSPPSLSQCTAQSMRGCSAPLAAAYAAGGERS